jgi:hypothetical protein
MLISFVRSVSLKIQYLNASTVQKPRSGARRYVKLLPDAQSSRARQLVPQNTRTSHATLPSATRSPISDKTPSHLTTQHSHQPHIPHSANLPQNTRRSLSLPPRPTALHPASYEPTFTLISRPQPSTREPGTRASDGLARPTRCASHGILSTETCHEQSPESGHFGPICMVAVDP